MYVHN